MGFDPYMNPPNSPPIWEQVKALQERYSESVQRLRELNVRVQELERANAAQERTIARLSVQLNGAPFPGEEEDESEAEARRREAERCTCGVKTPQREYHKHGCPRAL